MPRSLPPKNKVLDLLATLRESLEADEIAKQLGVEEKSFPGFLRLLDDLALNGDVTVQAGNRFQLSRGHTGRPTTGRPPPPAKGLPSRAVPPKGLPQNLRPNPNRHPEKSTERSAPPKRSSRAATGELREGVVTIAPRGFGFVSSQGSVGDDVFIGNDKLGGAMHGDRVKIAIIGRNDRGPEGEIVEIVARNIKRVAGVLRRRGKSAWLEPDDNRVRGPIVLEEAIDTVAGEGNSGKDGDAAVISILRYPVYAEETPIGKLEAVLGTPGELKVEVAKVLVREQIEEIHSEEAFREAEAHGTEVRPEMLEGREDLTHLPLPTIDPEDARDHDDAVWVERTPNGGYKAWIAIADVSSYVQPGTQIDAESLKRGCSVYLPDRAIPMLPRPLSSNLCSLLPDVVRLCLCAEVDIDAAGTTTKTRLIRGFMKSRAKLTYGGVARALGLSELPPRDPKADELIDGLRVAHELSRILRAKRLKRGAVDFDLPEAKIVLGENGQPTDIERRAQDAGTKKAYQLIEELMLLANETVAEWLVGKKVPTIFRVHAPPDEKKLARFSLMCEALGVEFDPETAKDPKKLTTLLKQLADHPKANVLNMLLLRSMKQATYDVVNIGHFGLASKAYLHFTSPIRRYPDLVVHRSVHRVLKNEPIDRSEEGITVLGEAAFAASTAERKVMEVEREVTDLYRAVLMRDKIGERFEGTVTALVGSGVFVALDAPFVDVLVKFDDLGGDRYELDEDGLRAVAARSGDVVQLGDRMMVQIIDVAILRRSVLGRRIGGGGGGDARGDDGGARRGAMSSGKKKVSEARSAKTSDRGRPQVSKNKKPGSRSQKWTKKSDGGATGSGPRKAKGKGKKKRR